VVLGLDAIETRTLTIGDRMAEAIDATLVDDAKPARRGGRGLIIGLVAAVALGGGGFYASWSGLVDPAALFGGAADAPASGSVPTDVAFVAMEPIMISLPPGSSARHLRFSGQLEVDPAVAPEVAALSPRILDTLNTYLRAVEVADLENPAALQRLRAQMLRRVQVVTGEGGVRDLLITEFILN
jgi:flagellar FliL protein